MGRLIDADVCLNKAWQNFYKQEDEHEKNIEGYDIMRDQFYEQSGFECCQQTIVNAPTVEAIPKTDYENCLKADMVAILTDIQLDIEELKTDYDKNLTSEHGIYYAYDKSSRIVQNYINALKENKNE